ncbi:MAG: hypothetical protein ACXQT3_06160 [Methermicoccaceae archaeon]
MCEELLQEAADALQNCWPIEGNGTWDPLAVWDLIARIDELLQKGADACASSRPSG